MMSHERDRPGRHIGEQIDAYDRAVRRARMRRTVLGAVVGAGVLALLGGLLGLALRGVDGILGMAALGLVAGILMGMIGVGYEIYKNSGEGSTEDW